MRMILFAFIVLSTMSCCAVAPKIMYVDSLKDIDTTYVKICCVDSSHTNPKVYIVEYRDKK